MSTFDTSIQLSRNFRSNTGWLTSAANHCLSFLRGSAVVGLTMFGFAHAAQLQVTWTDNSTDETGFKVERSLNGAAFTQIATVGANVTTYVDSNLQAGTYSYRIRAYSDLSDSDYTDPTAVYNLTTNVAPSVSSQPSSQTVVSGSTATFTVVATGSPTPTFQWLKNGSVISGATSNILTLTNVTTADGANYTVSVSNLAGSVQSSAALLSVTTVSSNVAPTFALQPANATVAPGVNATLTVSVSGTPAASLQWQKDGAAISGATAATLTLTNVTSASAGSYRVVATNSAGSAMSTTALLTVSTASAAPVFVLQPVTQAAALGATVNLSVSVTGNPTPSLQWQKDGVAVAGATSSTLLLTNITTGSAGSYRVIASNSAGSVTSASAVLTVAASAIKVAPTFVSQPSSQTVNSGSTVSLIAIATGTPAPTYQWKKNGAAIVGATSSMLTLTADSSTAGSYTATATNTAGSVESSSAQVAIAAAQVISSTRLVNASIRANAGQGADTLIVGFVTSGAQKSVLLRGIGPGLAPYTNATTFADPLLTLYSGKSALMANDNWSDLPGLQNVFNQVGAFALPSPGKDAALIAGLAPNAYTAQITGNGSGMALVELYDTDSAGGRITNIAARAGVNSSDNVVIVGFVVQGSSPKQVLIRGVGPSLAPLGVSGALPAARLQLFEGSTLLQENSGWGGQQSLVSAFAQVGAFPLSDASSKDAAFLATLKPGAYTVILSGSNSTAGIALIELYEMP